MKAETCTLTSKQERFIAAMLEQPSVVAAAKSCNISERTARYWLKRPEVQLAWRAARKSAYDHAIARLQALCGQAALTLGKNLLNDTGATPGVRAVQIRAAELILNYSQHASEISDLQDQVDELKRLLDEGSQHGRTPTPLRAVK